jgi:carbamoyltransferase
VKKILGFSAYFHDSSACIIVGNKIVAAVQEERLTRKKHDRSFPEKSIEFCLSEAGIEASELDEIVFFEKPFTKFERILEGHTKQAPKSFLPFQKAIKSWLQQKFWIEDTFRKRFPTKSTFSYYQHHLSHAANACFQSNFTDAAFLTIDGVGERACTSFGTYSDRKLTPLSEQQYPHSIGLLYSAFTQYCGFKVNSGEYKLMGLAPYGKPKYTDLIYQEFISVSDEGVVELSLKKFGFLNDLKMINKRFEAAMGRKARKSSEPMDEFYMDVAASIQKVTEEIVLKVVNYIQHKTQKKHLVYAGGVALNCVINAQISQQSKFESVFIHSASGDSGCALGAAIWTANRLGISSLENNNEEFLGPDFNTESIKLALSTFPGMHFTELSESEIISTTAQAIFENKVVGWFQGKMEFGPRALGNRSILANPGNADMKSVLNLKIKKREGFRPFAPVVLSDHFDSYFENQGNDYSRMLYVTQGAAKSSSIPACIHEDNTARVQRLSPDFNPKLHTLISKFHELSGIPVVINTSFNERGEPVVCNPSDAIRCFLNTEMDLLVMGNTIIKKEENLTLNIALTQYEMD